MSVQDGTLTRQPSPRPEFIGKDKGVGGGALARTSRTRPGRGASDPRYRGDL